MNRVCLQVVCNVLVAWLLLGCSTPDSRAHAHAAALHRLSPADQRLVLHGRVRPGISQEAVYIAWGEPDAKTPCSGGKAASETWVYRQRLTIYEPINSYYYTGPTQGFGGDPGRGSMPAYAYGGVGYEGALRYQPHVRSLDSVRIAEFGGGKLDRSKGADGTWFGSTPPVVATLTVAPAHRKLPHVASLLTTSTRSRHQARVETPHGEHVPAFHGIVAHTHQLHHGGNTGLREEGGRAASSRGSNASARGNGASGSRPGHRLHRLGHAHQGTPREPKRGTA